jgi:hypothetical protein
MSHLLAKVACLAAALSFFVVSTGCGTLFGSDSLKVKITSNPTGAKVRLNEEVVGITPIEGMEIDPLKDNTVEAKADGYLDYKGKLDITVNLPTVANFLFPPFFIVDLITGHWARVKPLKIVFLDEDGIPAPSNDNW